MNGPGKDADYGGSPVSLPSRRRLRSLKREGARGEDDTGPAGFVPASASRRFKPLPRITRDPDGGLPGDTHSHLRFAYMALCRALKTGLFLFYLIR